MCVCVWFCSHSSLSLFSLSLPPSPPLSVFLLLFFSLCYSSLHFLIPGNGKIDGIWCAVDPTYNIQMSARISKDFILHDFRFSQSATHETHAQWQSINMYIVQARNRLPNTTNIQYIYVYKKKKWKSFPCNNFRFRFLLALFAGDWPGRLHTRTHSHPAAVNAFHIYFIVLSFVSAIYYLFHFMRCDNFEIYKTSISIQFAPCLLSVSERDVVLLVRSPSDIARMRKNSKYIFAMKWFVCVCACMVCYARCDVKHERDEAKANHWNRWKWSGCIWLWLSRPSKMCAFEVLRLSNQRQHRQFHTHTIRAYAKWRDMHRYNMNACTDSARHVNGNGSSSTHTRQ